MDPVTWLVQRAPGFSSLSQKERKAIKDFAFLWSLYEAEVLDADGNACAIIRQVNLLRDGGKLALDKLRDPIAYFKHRYCDGTDLTHAFQGLKFRAENQRQLVERVVRGQASNDADVLSAMIIIVLRLRNNLFHGEKWAYGIQGQFENFRNANKILMAVIDMHKS